MMKKLLIIILTIFTLHASAQVPDTIRIKVHGGGGLSESKIAQMISDSLSKMDLSIYTKQQVDSITAVLRSEIQVAAGGGITKAQLDSAANLKLNITDLPGNVSYFNNDVPYLKAVDIANKVDKTTTVNGHPLSSNVTVTNTDVGLGNVPNIDATNPSNIVQTSVYRFVSDANITSWNNKYSNSGGDTLKNQMIGNTGAVYRSIYSGTGYSSFMFQNAGGQFYIGQESSVDGSFYPGSTAYSNVFYSGHPFQFLIGGKSFEVNASGAALTRASDGIGDFVTRNPTTNQLQIRTAAEALNDMGGASNSAVLHLTDTTQYQQGIKNKKWVIFGDSFSATPNRYYGRVDSLLGFTGTVTLGVSGNKFNQQSAILDSIINVNPNYFKSFNICSILLGVNDFAGSMPLGSRNDSVGQATDAGYLKNMITKVLTSNPFIQLYVMTPPEANGAGVIYKATNSAGWSLKNLEILISQICSDYGVQCIDLYSLANFNLQTIPYLTSDGLHPNYDGSVVLAGIISNAFINNNNKGVLQDGNTAVSLQAASQTGNTITGKVKIGGTGTPLSQLEVVDSITVSSPIASAWYGINFNLSDAYVKQQASTGVLQLNSGRNSSWGGSISFLTDLTEKLRLNTNGVTFPVVADASGDFLTRDRSTGLISRRSGTEALNDMGGISRSLAYSNVSLDTLNNQILSKSQAIFNSYYTGTGYTFQKFSNAGGQFYIGQESSVAGSFFPGSSAYGNVFYSSQPFQFLIGGKRFEINSNGAALTQTVNGIGDFVTRNTTTSQLQIRTAAQTLTDIGAEPAFTKNTGFNKPFGRTLNTVVDGKEFIDSLTSLNARKVDTSFKQPLGLVDPARYDSANKKIYMRQTWLDSIRNSSFATVNFGLNNLNSGSFSTTKDFVIDNNKALWFAGQGNLFQNGLIPMSNYNGGFYVTTNGDGAHGTIAGRENMTWTPTGIGIDGVNIPTAKIHFAVGSGNAGDAYMKIPDAPLMMVPENNAVEKHNGRLYITTDTTRNKITYESDLKAYLAKDSIGNRNYANDSIAVTDGHLGLYDFYRTGNIVKIVSTLPQFVLTYTVDNTANTNDSTQFFVSFSVANQPLYVDWGDGSAQSVYNNAYGSSQTPTHKYTSAGTYTVRFSMASGGESTITNFWINNYPYQTNINSITNLDKLINAQEIDLSGSKELNSSIVDFIYPPTVYKLAFGNCGLTSFVPTHNLPPTITTLNISGNNLTSAEVDNTINWLATQTFNAGAKTLNITEGGSAPPTSASSAALSTLTANGWTVSHD